MRFVLFYHSLLSDWNHGNAHFLRGLATELKLRGHEVCICEPADSWSRRNLEADHGTGVYAELFLTYPLLRDSLLLYDPQRLDLDRVLDKADVVLVHEWNDPQLVQRIGRHRRHGAYRLFFHDTHHRCVSDPAAMARYDLADYDGVLAFGAVIRDLYLERGWARAAWTWHEAADVHVFKPLSPEPNADLVWIGNWGDDERSRELREFLLNPARILDLDARVYGVRYPDHARRALAGAGIDYGGWLPNFQVPQAFARHRVTVHVPRRPYVERLPGIPTIRPFEAMACGIPLICAPWEDSEGLFTAGKDYLVAHNGREMTELLNTLLHDSDLAAALAEHGRATIRARHTCAHRVDELLNIHRRLVFRMVRTEPPAEETQFSAREAYA